MAHGPKPNMHHLVDVSEFPGLVDEEVLHGDSPTEEEIYPGVLYDPISESGRTVLHSLADSQELVFRGETIA